MTRCEGEYRVLDAALEHLATERLARQLCGDRYPFADELARAFQTAWIDHLRKYADPTIDPAPPEEK